MKEEDRKHKKKMKRSKKVSYIFAIIAGLFFLFLMSNVVNNNREDIKDLFLIWGVIVFIGGIMGSVAQNREDKAKALGASSSRREIVKQSLSVLPDNYSVLSNVELNHAGKNVVFDTIVIGDTGVFVIGSCNRNGDLDGQESSVTWVQHKVGRGGTPYSNEFKNPFKKLYFQKKFLEEFLTDCSAHLKVAGS